MNAYLLVLALGFIGFVAATVNKVFGDMVAEEVRTRLDRLADVVVRIALWRLPPSQRDYRRAEYEDTVLNAMVDETAGLPITRLFSAIGVGFSLWRRAASIRRDTKIAQEDERRERLVKTDIRDGAMHLGTVIQSGAGTNPRNSFDFVFRGDDGRLHAVELKGPSSWKNANLLLRSAFPTDIWDVRGRMRRDQE